MIQLKRILLPTDFSRCAEQALTHAWELAKQHGAELHMLHAIVLHEDDPHNAAHHFADIDEIHSRIKQTASAEMDSNLEKHAGEVKVVKAHERGIAPATVIMDYARDHDIDLIVMGTHGRRGLEHFLLGSVAEEVVRMAGCPVMTIREQKDPKGPEATERILVPIDFSDPSKQALRYALELANTYQARLQLLHVVEETLHPAFYVTGKSSIFEFIPDIKDKSKESLERLVEEVAGKDVDADFFVVEGRAARDITKFARENDSDLIVISTHGLTGIEHLLVGSVTEKVVRMASCPVFTVKTYGRALI